MTWSNVPLEFGDAWTAFGEWASNLFYGPSRIVNLLHEWAIYRNRSHRCDLRWCSRNDVRGGCANARDAHQSSVRPMMRPASQPSRGEGAAQPSLDDAMPSKRKRAKKAARKAKGKVNVPRP